MRVLVAPDSFKGSLDPLAVANALRDGWRRARPLDDIRLLPLADGGEGTLEAIKATRDDWIELPAHAADPLGNAIRATFLRRGDEAVVELATASGLSRVAADTRDAMAATTFGTGQVLATAVGLGRASHRAWSRRQRNHGRRQRLALCAWCTISRRERRRAATGRRRPRVRLARVDLTEIAPVLAEVSLDRRVGCDQPAARR